jgi:predicted SnoaL-like aldol condensation-catalyzing enzyme
MSPSGIEKALAVLRGIGDRDAYLATKYMNPEKYVQHNPYAGDGVDGLKEYISQFPREHHHDPLPERQAHSTANGRNEIGHGNRIYRHRCRKQIAVGHVVVVSDFRGRRSIARHRTLLAPASVRAASTRTYGLESRTQHT